MTLRFPVAVWQDFAGAYTASVLDGPSLSAHDRTAAGALSQLERYLTWALRKGAGLPASSDFIDLQLRDYRVEVRPEYRVDETVYPLAEKFSFRITCVHGRRRDGTLHCVAPTLGIRLSYQPGDPIDRLMPEALHHALGRSTPQELSRQLMPPQIRLDAIHLRERPPAEHDKTRRYETLESVATQLGVRRRGGREVRAIARDQEVRQLSDHLSSGRANLLLLGEAGIGKSTVLAEAIRILQRRKPKPRENDDALDSTDPPTQFWRTSGHRLIAGMKYLGQWEQRCEQVIGELAETGGVLCVEELLELVRLGGREPGGSLAAFFQPYLERGELRMVAEATPAQLDACRRLLPGFAEHFHVVRVPEFSATDARAVLDRLLSEGSRNHKLMLEPGLADLIYRLFRRFQPYAAFPGRSVAFVRHLLEHVVRDPRDATTRGQHRRSATSPAPLPPAATPRDLTSADVVAEFQRMSGLPARLLRDDLPLPHAEVLAAFRERVLGQEAACQVAAGIVTTLKTGLNDPQRPLGVLLFCGPTGVGKTEMAKALADYLFGGGGATDRLLRLDMSEYAGPGAAHRLMLSPDGEPSEFIKQARRQPFTVVLLDEIEKAAPEVHDALLGVLDEGRLTDRFGRVTTFRSAVIVMTSNLGAERTQALGFDGNVQPPFERVALEHFRPEFVNRLDAIVTFEPLSQDTIRSLVTRELRSLARREGLTSRNLMLTWGPEVVEHLAQSGFDLRYGARPLQRAVEQLVVAPLSRWLLENRNISDAQISISADGQAIRIAAS